MTPMSAMQDLGAVSVSNSQDAKVEVWMTVLSFESIKVAFNTSFPEALAGTDAHRCDGKGRLRPCLPSHT